MTRYLSGVEGRLRDAGFEGRVLVLTSQGGTMDAAELARMPIHAINSGPSMAPIGGRYYAGLEGLDHDIIVADTGGTTYDVSLVRGGAIPWTRETWIGAPYSGHMTGFPSVDVKSVGAGGGSIAWVDAGGVLHVGPMSAGAKTGPVAYGAGGVEPTVTDACIVLGYIDPDFFLGGSVKLDKEAARAAIQTRVADRLGLDVEAAASAIVDLVTQNMVQAIADITVNQGIDAAQAVLIGGGGGRRTQLRFDRATPRMRVGPVPRCRRGAERRRRLDLRPDGGVPRGVADQERVVRLRRGQRGACPAGR